MGVVPEVSGGEQGCSGVFRLQEMHMRGIGGFSRVCFVSETAQVELKSE